MAGKNWRNLHWRDMERSERIWFVLMCALLGILIVAIILEGTDMVSIPDWAVLMWVAAAGYAVHKNITGNGLWNDEDQNGDIDTEEDDDDDDCHDRAGES